jgi:PAS domain S-box-containing protein
MGRRRQPTAELPPQLGVKRSTMRGTRTISVRFILVAMALNTLVGGSLVIYDVADSIWATQNFLKGNADQVADICDRLRNDMRGNERAAVAKTAELTDYPMALLTHDGRIAYSTDPAIAKHMPTIYQKPPTQYGNRFEISDELDQLSGAWAIRPFSKNHNLLLIVPRPPEEEGVLRYMTIAAGLVGIGVALSFIAMLFAANWMLQRPLNELVGQLTGALSRALAFRTNLLDSSEAVGMLATDDKGKIIVYNRAAEKVIGYSEDEVVNRINVDDLREMTHRPPKKEIPLRSLIQLSEGEEFLVDREGREHLVEINTSTIMDEEENTLGQLIIFIDVTQRKRLEAELQINELQLVQSAKMASVGEMATGVAHELNQPLNNIGLLCSRISKRINNDDSPETGEFVKDKMAKIQGQVRRASKIINQLRVFGRPSKTSIGAIGFGGPVNNVVDLLGEQFKQSGIYISVNIPSDLPLVEADESQLEQVIINILNNARDALLGPEMKRGDRQITIHAERGKLRDKDNGVCLHLADNGPGMDEDLESKVFQPFFTTKEVGKGTGLGLSISYSLIRGLGGTLEVVSKRDEGTTFTITLRQTNVANESVAAPPVLGGRHE